MHLFNARGDAVNHASGLSSLQQPHRHLLFGSFPAAVELRCSGHLEEWPQLNLVPNTDDDP